MEMIIPTGEKLTFELSDVRSIYDKIPERSVFGVKRFNRTSSCSEIDARYYFHKYWGTNFYINVALQGNKKLAMGMVYINSDNARRYAIPKPNETNCEVIMTLFVYITFFATSEMVNGKNQFAIIKATSSLFPILKDNWSAQILDIVNETIKRDD